MNSDKVNNCNNSIYIWRWPSYGDNYPPIKSPYYFPAYTYLLVIVLQLNFPVVYFYNSTNFPNR